MEDREIRDLEKSLEQIWEVALRFGLDPFPTRFEMVPATVMYEIGSYALPGRYSHWTFGKAYHKMKTMYGNSARNRSRPQLLKRSGTAIPQRLRAFNMCD